MNAPEKGEPYATELYMGGKMLVQMSKDSLRVFAKAFQHYTQKDIILEAALYQYDSIVINHIM